MTLQVVRAPPGYEHVRPRRATEYDAYPATHLALRREVVVVEIPRAAFVRPGAVGRLCHDTRALLATTTPTVIRILDLDTRRDPVRVTIEQVPGRILGDLLDVGPLRPDLAMQVLGDVADALQAMASKGLVHGSVSAENVFISPDGRTRLGGFGIARALRTTEPDQRTDAYDFAWLAHRTLTGAPPTRSAEDGLRPLPWRAAEVLLAGLADRPQERPLPHELVEVLRSIPAEEWITSRAPLAPAPARAPQKARVLPPQTAPAPARERRRPRIGWPHGAKPPGWFRWAVIAVGMTATSGSAVAGVQMLEPWRMISDTVEVHDISIEVEPGATGQCPKAEMVFVATIETNGKPGELTFSWTRPDGSQPELQRVEVAEGQDTVQTRADFTFSGRQAWSGRAFLRVDGDDAGMAHRTVDYLCSSG